MKPIPGLIACACILAMAATSFDRSAAWIGPRASKLLHRTGSAYIWIAFANAFLVRALKAPGYWVPVALLVLGLLLRLAAWRTPRRVHAAATSCDLRICE